MQTLEIKTRKHGTVTFCMPTAGGYVRVDLNGASGTLGSQICDGGMFSGSTISASPKSFEKTCRRWWAARLKAIRE